MLRLLSVEKWESLQKSLAEKHESLSDPVEEYIF